MDTKVASLASHPSKANQLIKTKQSHPETEFNMINALYDDM